MPLFSVVIPTRNRPTLVRDAIQSVLLQDFGDFELIISDNSSTQETSQILRTLQGRGPFTVIRPPVELNMIDHWEFATRTALGTYVVVLADRSVLMQHALNRMAATAQRYPDINCFSHGSHVFLEHLGKLGTRVQGGRTRVWKSVDLVMNFLSTPFYSRKSLDNCFPKTLGGFFRNTFAHEVRARFGRYLNINGVITPDYSSFFVNCALNEKCLFLGEVLQLTQGVTQSNGAAAFRGDCTTHLQSLGARDFFDRVLIKAPFLYNFLVNDFCVIKERIGGLLSGFEVDPPAYFQTTYYELLLKQQFAVDPQFLALLDSEWRKAARLAKVDSTAIMRAARRQFGRGSASQPIARTALIKAHIRDYLHARFDEGSLANRLFRFRHKSILDAAGFRRDEATIAPNWR